MWGRFQDYHKSNVDGIMNVRYGFSKISISYESWDNYQIDLTKLFVYTFFDHLAYDGNLSL